MIRATDQGSLDFTAPDAPLPKGVRVRVRGLKPVAPDGATWEARLEALYDQLGRERPEGFYPSDLRAAADEDGLGDPPHGAGAWGRVASRMGTKGWTTRIVPRTSRVGSRNQATEFRLWVPPAGAAKEGARA